MSVRSGWNGDLDVSLRIAGDHYRLSSGGFDEPPYCGDVSVPDGGSGSLRADGRARIQGPADGVGINDDVSCPWAGFTPQPWWR